MGAPEEKDPQVAVLEVIEESKKGSEDDTFTVSSGVVFRAKQVPMKIIMGVMAKYDRPEPPTMFEPGLGREVPNPDDPDYKRAIQVIDSKTTEAVMNVMVIYGTEIVKVPKGMSKPEDEDWLEMLEATGVGISEKNRENKYWRYLNWFATVAAPNASDMVELMNNAGKLSGVSEGDVASAATFPESS